MTLKGVTVLVVDDEPDLRDLLAFEFDELGCKVLQAESGNEGMKIFDSNRVDVVISDIRMPGGSGLELLEHIKKKNNQTPPVFLITGFADVTEEQALEKGAEKLFHKPFDIDDIVAAICNAVSKRVAC